MRPTRKVPPRVITALTSRTDVRIRFPSRVVDRSSLPRVSRCRREKRRSSRDGGSGAGVLRRELNGEALSPLLSSTAENFTSPFGRHTLAESVRANASLVAGTICGLAHSYSKRRMNFLRRPVNVSGTRTLGQAIASHESHRIDGAFRGDCNFRLGGLASLPLPSFPHPAS